MVHFAADIRTRNNLTEPIIIQYPREGKQPYLFLDRGIYPATFREGDGYLNGVLQARDAYKTTYACP
jgi:hypothetical protein